MIYTLETSKTRPFENMTELRENGVVVALFVSRKLAERVCELLLTSGRRKSCEFTFEVSEGTS